MSRFEKFMSAVILGTLAPVILMLSLWWGSIPFANGNDKLIMYLALTGLVTGIILDLTLLRGFLQNLFNLPLTALIAIEAFYSVMIYGFFMGFPVFNCLVGITGAYVAVRTAVLQNKTKHEALKQTKFINIVSGIMLFILCISTALLALRESTICLQVKGMLNLPFDITMQMIWALIIGGAAFLLLFQYAVSRLVCKRVILKV